VRLGKWKLVALHREPWELYNMEADRTESTNLASQFPDRVKEMSALYDAWAKRCHVVPPEELPPVRPTIPARP
jgi:arylsulfatase A-like enzyme